MEYQESITKFSSMMESTNESISLWHGGRLKDAYNSTQSHASGRWEFGPGLYLTSKYEVAKKYAKGSRKLYQVEIEKGNEIRDVDIPIRNVEDFITRSVISKKRSEIRSRLDKYITKDKVPAHVFLNILIDEDAVAKRNTNTLREFLVVNGIDYVIDSNTYGWGEMMLVLFNMEKMIGQEVVSPKADIDVYDLPQKFTRK